MNKQTIAVVLSCISRSLAILSSAVSAFLASNPGFVVAAGAVGNAALVVSTAGAGADVDAEAVLLSGLLEDAADMMTAS